MESETYDEWVSIFDETFKSVWVRERTELRRMSMIYYAFQIELNRLNKYVSGEFSNISFELKKKDYMEKRKKFVGLVQSEKFDITVTNKENQTPCTVPLNEECSGAKTEEIFIETPTTEHNIFIKESTPPTAFRNDVANSPVLNNNSANRIKRKKSNSPLSLNVTKVKTPIAEETPCAFRTPKNPDDSNIMECSITEDTRNTKPLKRPKKPRLQLKSRNKSTLNKSKQASTLTQMFFEPKKTNKHIDSNLPSMSVTEMINLINDSSSDTDVESDETIDNLEIPTPCKIGQKSNQTLAQSSNNEEPKFVFNEVVRGKDRQKLKGWSCNECKEYYEGLNLAPEELQKKKDQCSRHKSRFKPREETYAGFWDLTFGPTQATDEEDSLVLNYKKK